MYVAHSLWSHLDLEIILVPFDIFFEKRKKRDAFLSK